MLKEESVNNTTHLEIVITPNPFDIKPLLPANLVCPPPPCLQTGDGGRWWCFEKRQKLEHLLHFPFLHCHQSHHHMTIEALENVVLKSISKFQERERERRRVPSLLVTCAFVASMEKPKCFLYSMYAWPRAHSRKYSVVVMRGIFNPICSCVTLQNYA